MQHMIESGTSSAATKLALGECPLTASHTRRACDNGGSCWCVENPDEVAAINACIHEWEYDAEESKGPWTGYIERCSLCGALQQVPQ